MTKPFTKMKPGIKRRWIEALTSGKYKQGRDQLKSPESEYCCLGVLCDLYRRSTERGEWSTSPIDGSPFFRVTRGEEISEYDVLPPETVLAWAGLDDEAISLLTTANDGQTPGGTQWVTEGRFSFVDIATLIDAYL